MIEKDYYGPWAVIAGGSEGVGPAYARLLAEAGIGVVLIARKPGPLEETAAAVRAAGGEARTIAVDLLADDALEKIRAVTDGLDVGLFVFNAGAGSYAGEFVTSDLDAVRRTVDLNIACRLTLVHHFGARLKARGRGGILMMGSMNGYLGAPQISFYGAAKAFGRIFAEGLWLELAPHGVHVLELVPGGIRTPALGRLGFDLDDLPFPAAEPADVAREGLAHLADGPVWVTEGNAETARRQSGPDRAALLRAAYTGGRRVTAAAHRPTVPASRMEVPR
ncbi:SDR family NAD(P)-dependent oxidoreductase [Tomitella gaofuii]|uniref:SDR family NAD(P)-dependent oxidoreductase n=1 Tax=Tomitella gaofuii TaxID=2760083 RepID=UPI0015F93D54|nr:SDR family NAD(P)-dependent oxidoreductase [Tomitella gaofuii]